MFSSCWLDWVDKKYEFLFSCDGNFFYWTPAFQLIIMIDEFRTTAEHLFTHRGKMFLFFFVVCLNDWLTDDGSPFSVSFNGFLLAAWWWWVMTMRSDDRCVVSRVFFLFCEKNCVRRSVYFAYFFSFIRCACDELPFRQFHNIKMQKLSLFRPCVKFSSRCFAFYWIRIKFNLVLFSSCLVQRRILLVHNVEMWGRTEQYELWLANVLVMKITKTFSLSVKFSNRFFKTFFCF